MRARHGRQEHRQVRRRVGRGRWVRDSRIRHLRLHARQVAQAGRREEGARRGQQVRHPPTGLDALPVAASGADRIPRPPRQVRGWRRDEVPAHREARRKAAHSLGPRPLHLRVSRGDREGRQGRQDDLAVGGGAARPVQESEDQGQLQRKPRRVGRQDVQRIRRPVRVRRTRTRRVPAAVVQVRTLVRDRHRGGDGACRDTGPRAHRVAISA